MNIALGHANEATTQAWALGTHRLWPRPGACQA